MKALHTGRLGSRPNRYVLRRKGENAKSYFGFWCSIIWRERSIGPGPCEITAAIFQKWWYEMLRASLEVVLKVLEHCSEAELGVSMSNGTVIVSGGRADA